MEVILLDRGQFLIKSENGEDHKGRFCAGALDRFSSLQPDNDLIAFYEKMTKGMKLSDYAELVICAMEYEQETVGKYTKKQFYDWVDEMGGIMSRPFTLLVAHATRAIMPRPEKKSETPLASINNLTPATRKRKGK